MQEAVPVGAGAMAAILGLDAEQRPQACEEAAEGEVVSPANINGAGQVVIAGAAAAVQRASERAKALGAKRAMPLPVSAPFHCALMQPAEERLAPELRALRVATRACRSSPMSMREPKRDARGRRSTRWCAGVGAGAVGGGRAAPCVRGRHHVC